MRRPKSRKHRNQKSDRQGRARPDFGTLGAALSATAKQNLGNLRERLVRQVSEAVDAQRRRDKPAWHAGLDAQRPLTGQTARGQGGRREDDGGPRGVTAARLARATGHDSLATGVFGPQREPVLERRRRRAGFEFWTLPADFRVRRNVRRRCCNRTAPDSMRIAKAAIVERRGGDPLFVTIGLDFGTSLDESCCSAALRAE